MSPYDSWSTEALNGYIVMMEGFLSGSMQAQEDQVRRTYAERLTAAKQELVVRNSSFAQ